MFTHRRNNIPTKRCLDNTNLRCSGIKTGECAPVIDDKSGADYIRSSINSPGLTKEQSEG